jgi:hypothetical protein
MRRAQRRHVRSSVKAALALLLLLPSTFLLFFAFGFRLICALGVVLRFNQLGIAVRSARPVRGVALRLSYVTV